MSIDRSQLSAAGSYAGKAVRYSFYAAGVFIFTVVGLIALQLWSVFGPPTGIAAQAAFQANSEELARLKPTAGSARVYGGYQHTLQYGQVTDRDTDFTLVVYMPTSGDTPVVHDFSREVSSLRPLLRSPYIGSNTFYDLETRFGPVRASSFQINADGLTKLCVSYVSRFETPAVAYKGWLCEASGVRPNFHTLACILDRVTLRSTLPTAAAQSFFEERMARAGRCTATPVSQTTDTRPLRTPRRL